MEVHGTRDQVYIALTEPLEVDAVAAATNYYIGIHNRNTFGLGLIGKRRLFKLAEKTLHHGAFSRNELPLELNLNETKLAVKALTKVNELIQKAPEPRIIPFSPTLETVINECVDTYRQQTALLESNR